MWSHKAVLLAVKDYRPTPSASCKAECLLRCALQPTQHQGVQILPYRPDPSEAVSKRSFFLAQPGASFCVGLAHTPSSVSPQLLLPS